RLDAFAARADTGRLGGQAILGTCPAAALASPAPLGPPLHEQVGRTPVSAAGVALQIARASSRDGNTREQIEAIMATQISRGERISQADDIIHNHGDLAELEQQVTEAHSRYLALCTSGYAG